MTKYKEIAYAEKCKFDGQDREILESDHVDDIFPLMLQIAECMDDYEDYYKESLLSTVYERRFFIAYHGIDYLLVYEYLTETYYLYIKE